MNQEGRRVLLTRIQDEVEGRLGLEKGRLQLFLTDNGHDVTGKIGAVEYPIHVENDLWEAIYAAAPSSEDEARSRRVIEKRLVDKLRAQLFG